MKIVKVEMLIWQHENTDDVLNDLLVNIDNDEWIECFLLTSEKKILKDDLFYDSILNLKDQDHVAVGKWFNKMEDYKKVILKKITKKRKELEKMEKELEMMDV